MTKNLLLLASASCAVLASSPAFAQDQQPASPAAGAASAGAVNPEDIVITGTRAGQIKAITAKRKADNTVEALYANDVGKLPDQNVAEAVKRLPGLSVANDQGEGRYVIIRGIDPALVNVTLNGQTLPAPEPDGRLVKLDDLPSALIQSVVVTKSLLPDVDANAIGGSVDIRTKTAFDSPEPFFFDARGSVGRYSLNHLNPWEVDATAGGRSGPFGAVVSVNYSRRPIESENFQGSEDWSNGGVPDGNGLRDYNLTRTRLGVVGNFDYRPSDSVALYLRTSYSKFQDHETRDQNRLAVDFSTNPLQAAPTILVRHREENDNTKSMTLGGDFGIGAGLLQMSGGWTRAEKVDPIRSEFTFKASNVTVDYDSSTDPYTLVPSGSGASVFSDPAAFKFNKYNFEHRSAFEEIWQGRADYSHPISVGDDSSIKFGFKYLDRHKADDHDKLDYKAGTKWTLDQGGVAYLAGTNFYDDLYSFGDRIDYFAARDYVTANPGVVKIDNAGTLADSLSSDYDVREQISAGYVMATLKWGGLTLVPGVRVEHTKDRTKAKLVDANSALGDDFNSFGENSYTDWFPGLNAKYEFGNGLLARAAVTTAIGRPNYPDLAPYVVVEDDTVPNVSLGNPDLKPYKSVNFDASLEYYPGPGGILAAGVFHKSIDNPIYPFSDRRSDVLLGGVTYALADVGQPINADKEQVSGIEFNAQYQFLRLPGFMSGFGIAANYAHIWGHSTAAGVRAGNIPLGFQSHDVGNIQLFYEKYGLSARLAFNYRSAYLDALGGSADEDQFTDANGQLDFHISYQVMPQVTVFGDATNLTDAPWRRYVGQTKQLIEREHYGRSLRAGVQVHF